MLAIFKRELRAYFSSPMGYIFLAAVYLLGGYFFSYMLANNSSQIEIVFGSMFNIIVIIIPLLTMRLLSEDKKQKTDQLLLTSPVNTGSIILGKYFASFTMYLIGIASTLVYVIILSTFTTPNWNIFLGNFLALALAGGALIAVGLFISSLTENQVIAAIISLVAMVFILLYDTVVYLTPDSLGFIKTIMQKLSFISRYDDFVNGILNVSHILFFVSMIVVFNFLTARILERKRWS